MSVFQLSDSQKLKNRNFQIPQARTFQLVPSPVPNRLKRPLTSIQEVCSRPPPWTDGWPENMSMILRAGDPDRPGGEAGSSNDRTSHVGSCGKKHPPGRPEAKASLSSSGDPPSLLQPLDFHLCHLYLQGHSLAHQIITLKRTTKTFFSCLGPWLEAWSPTQSLMSLLGPQEACSLGKGCGVQTFFSFWWCLAAPIIFVLSNQLLLAIHRQQHEVAPSEVDDAGVKPGAFIMSIPTA